MDNVYPSRSMTKLKSNQFMLDGHLITELPILMQTEMVKATLDDRKTQTRRTIKPSIENGKHTPWNHRESNVWQWQTGKVFVNYKDDERRCPYGQPGDLLWVRESFFKLPFDMVNSKTGLHYSYFADCDADSLKIAKDYGFKLKPSIHMPKTAARIWLMVEDIRVERVQDISEEDAMAEGIEELDCSSIHSPKFRDYNPSWARKTGGVPICKTARKSFQTLWISINGEDSWQSNPWVWVVKFRVLSKTGRALDETILASRLSILNSRKEVING